MPVSLTALHLEISTSSRSMTSKVHLNCVTCSVLATPCVTDEVPTALSFPFLAQTTLAEPQQKSGALWKGKFSRHTAQAVICTKTHTSHHLSCPITKHPVTRTCTLDSRFEMADSCPPVKRFLKAAPAPRSHVQAPALRSEVRFALPGSVSTPGRQHFQSSIIFQWDSHG